MLEPNHTSSFEFDFNYVSSLSELTSNEFANLKLEKNVLYTLLLNNVTSINQFECLNLFKFKGLIIELNGLKEISLEIAEILAGYNGALSLGIQKIDPLIANVLATHKAALSLTKLKSIDDISLIYLSKYEGNVLEFNSLETLTVNQAKQIVTYKGEFLSLDGLRIISTTVAKELSLYPGFLFLSGLENMPVDVANELANHTGSLALDGLTTISDEVAIILSAKKGTYLELKGITKLL